MWEPGELLGYQYRFCCNRNKEIDCDNYKTVRAIHTGTFRISQSVPESKQYYRRNNRSSKICRTGTTPPATIPTVSNASIGLTLNLFDYDLDEYLDNRFNNKDYPVSITIL